MSKEHLIPVQFKEGEQVWLEGRNLKTHHLTAKLAPHRYSPFLIAKKLSPVTYHLALPPSMKIHPIFHVDLLTWYCETHAHGPNYEQPALDIVNSKPEREVEKIINSRLTGWHKALQFLVWWKGFPPSEDFWVPELDLSAPNLMTSFYTTHPHAP